MGEELLINTAKRGDLSAFNQLVEIYQQRVFNLAYRILGDSEASADATQDTFFQAYKALNQYRGGSFKSWIFRITSNICYDRLRTRRRRPTSSLDEMIEEAEEIGGSSLSILEDPESDPGNTTLRREMLQELEKALAKLPADQKLVVVLSDVEGMSYEEIAAITGISLGTVKSRLSRGRSKLRDILLKTELLSDDVRPKYMHDKY